MQLKPDTELSERSKRRDFGVQSCPGVLRAAHFLSVGDDFAWKPDKALIH